MSDFDSPGVRRLTGEPGRVAREAAAAGWRTGVISGAATKREVLAAVGEALAFPSHYGQNLDALWDCLTELAGPTALVWAGWEDLAVDHPRDWAALIDLFAERAAQEPAFLVLLVGGAGDSP